MTQLTMRAILCAGDDADFGPLEVVAKKGHVCPISYSIPSMRAAGLDAMWRTVDGKPAIYARDKAGAAHSRDHWWLVDAAIYAEMHKRGVLAGFRHCIKLGDLAHCRG